MKPKYEIEKLAIWKMILGHKVHGSWEPDLNTENMPNNGLEEAADSANYADMERQILIAQFGDKISSDDLDDLYLELQNIKHDSFELGISWIKYRDHKAEVFGKLEKK